MQTTKCCSNGHFMIVKDAKRDHFMVVERKKLKFTADDGFEFAAHELSHSFRVRLIVYVQFNVSCRVCAHCTHKTLK